MNILNRRLSQLLFGRQFALQFFSLIYSIWKLFRVIHDICFLFNFIQLFIIIGNKRANSFWAGNLPPDEELHMDAPAEKRIAFITQKYKEGKFRKTPFPYKTKEQLNKVISELISSYHNFCTELYLCAF